MGLVAIQCDVIDLSEYEPPNCLGSFTTQNTLKRGIFKACFDKRKDVSLSLSNLSEFGG